MQIIKRICSIYIKGKYELYKKNISYNYKFILFLNIMVFLIQKTLNCILLVIFNYLNVLIFLIPFFIDSKHFVICLVVLMKTEFHILAHHNERAQFKNITGLKRIFQLYLFLEILSIQIDILCIEAFFFILEK